jgi:hypothetical protein
MPRPASLVRHGRSSRGGRLIMTDKIDVATMKAIRKHLRKVHGITVIEQRAGFLQEKAFEWMKRMSRQVDTYGRLKGRCGRFNRYVAELLIIRDYDVLNQVAPIKIAYMELQMAAHHLIKGSEFDGYATAFRRLEKKTKDGRWTSYDTMPAIPLFAELHGLSPETLKDHHMMRTFDLNIEKNFSKELDIYVEANKKTGSLTELFEIHQDFYGTVMKSKFYQERALDGIGEGTLAGWFETMIRLAREVDVEMAAGR